PHVRVDTHIYQGYEVPPTYDSMLAKVITSGATRMDAIKVMHRALNEFNIGPIKTTIPFHLRLLENAAFIKGDISTHFVQEMMSAGIESALSES
ncbi:MAG: acetyl-CoA carboxylase biotin carboxylase subunit, partial [Candidatus Omnitrophota bacterium]